MARILIGWELGANTGHIVKLAEIAAVLVARGHVPVFAVQQIGAAPAGFPVWQAPLWPAQLATLSRSGADTPATMGDILAVLGLDDPVALRAMIAAWDAILAAVRPDAVAAEFAPALMLAARGRVPVVALGTGFSLPPAHLPHFASLTGRPAVVEEARLLNTLNGALRASGRAPLDRLPMLFAADREIAAAFRELDPYRAWRRSAPGVPSVMAVPAVATGGDELFVYMNGIRRWPDGFWQGVHDAAAASGVRVRVHDPRLGEADARVLEGAGMIVERRAVPFDRIAARSRLVLSHGGLGLASSCLLAGLPAAFVPFDIEKRMVAAGVADLNLGRRLDFELAEAPRLAAMLCAGLADAAMAERARAAAPAFRARMIRGCGEETADALEAVIG